MTRKSPSLRCIGALGVLLALASHAAAQSVADFYRSKGLTLIIGGGVGGGYDAYARTLARHFSKHVPGNPAIVVQNMEAAGGIAATNYIANRAPPDGSVILATYNSLMIQPLFDNNNLMFDPLTLSFIGSMGKQTNICVTRLGSEVTTLEKAKEREVTVSSTGVSSSVSQLPTVLNRLVGTKFKPIVGYTTTGMHLAMERGEVEGICGLSYATLKAAKPDWIFEHKMHILAQFGSARIAELPDVPLARDFVREPADRSVFEILAYPQEIGRPVLAPPGVPAERLAALRRAFDDTMADPDYRAESKKQFQDVDPLTGAAITEMLKRAYATPKEVVARAAELLTAPK
jgi:tripartite-type tricarboxylate transporter receptor subunit TctC